MRVLLYEYRCRGFSREKESGICQVPGTFPVELWIVLVKAGLFWSPGGTRERTSEAPSFGDPHDGAGVEAFM